MNVPDMVKNIQHLLRETLSGLLKLDPEQLDLNLGWEEYGYDPVIWGEWAKQLNDSYDLELSPAIFYEYPNLPALSQYLVEVHGDAFPDSRIAARDISSEEECGAGKPGPEGLFGESWAGMLSELVADYVRQRLEMDPSCRLHMLQIGSVAEAETALIAEKLLPCSTHIAEYSCGNIPDDSLLRMKLTDAAYPFLDFRKIELDIPLIDQQLLPGAYDLVIVGGGPEKLERARGIIREAKTVLRKNGVLLWEAAASQMEAGSSNRKLPELHGNTPEQKLELLAGEGFRQIEAAVCSPNRTLLLAESDGVVRLKYGRRLASLEPVSLPVQEHLEKQPFASEAATVKLASPAAASPASDGLLQDSSRLYLKRLIGETLRIPAQQMDSSEPFEKYGIDSIMVIELAAALRGVFSNISSTLFFEHTSIDALADHLLKTQRGKFLELLGAEAEQSPGVASRKPPGSTASVIPDPASAAHSGARFWKGKPGFSADLRQSAAPPTAVQDVAIIGVSGRYPEAGDIHEYWANLQAGRHCISEIPPDRWDWRTYYTAERGKPGTMYSRWGGFIRDIDAFDPLFFQISPAEAERMDPQERLFLEVAYASVEDAGYTPASLGQSRKIGVFVGVMNGNYPTGSSYWSIANRVSYLFHFQGPSLAVDTACSSSLTAIHLALESLYSGSCECAIAGGVNLIVDPVHYLKLSAMTMLSSGDKCKAFGDHADGFVDGEGVGAIVLKPLSKALSDGDHIYGVIKGSMINAGGKTHGYTVPNPHAQAEVVSDALRRAGVRAREVSYIEAHGTGTALGDPIEIAGLVEAFGKDTADTQFCAIGSVKSSIGHCESAAGIAGITKVLMQFKYGQVAPTLHAGKPNPEITFGQTPFILQQEPGVWKRPLLLVNGELKEVPRIAGISSFGAGGANAHLVIQEPPVKEKVQSRLAISPLHPALIVLSAKQEESLHQQARRLLEAIREQEWTESDLVDIAYTLQIGREAMEERLGLIATSLRQVEDSLRAFVSGEQNIDFLYRGQVQRNKETLMVFAADSELQEVTEKWIQHGKYGKLLEVWVRGGQVDWNQLYGGDRPQRISLPTYPFARERYWVSKQPQSTVERAADAGEAGVLHPLVQRNTSDMTEQRYSSRWSGEEFFLKDHVVQGQKMLPGAAYLEMAREAVRLASGAGSEMGVRLHQVVWLKPFTVEAGVERELHIALTAEDGGRLGFEVYSYSGETGGEAEVYSQGSAELYSREGGARLPALDVEALRRESQRRMSGEECYERFGELGIAYGPGHRGLDSLEIGPRGVLGKLSLPEAEKESAGEYVLHPGVLDAALQVCIGLEEEEGGAETLLPFALERLEIAGPAPARGWVWAREQRGKEAGAKLRKLDIDLYDESGAVCVRISGFTARAYTGEAVSGEMMPVDVSADYIESAAAEVVTAGGKTVDRLEERTLAYFKKLLSGVIKLPAARIEADAALEKYGIDSIMVMQLTTLLEQDFGVLSKTLFFEYQTLRELCGYFMEAHHNRLETLLIPANAVSPPERTATPAVQAAGTGRRKGRRFAPALRPAAQAAPGGAADIAVIGLSGRYPGARNVNEFWNRLRQGEDCVTEIPAERWDHSLYFHPEKDRPGSTYSKWGGFMDGVDRFDPLFFQISPREAEIMDPQERLFLQCVYETLEDAGYTRETLGEEAGGQVGVYVGVMYEEYQLYGAERTLQGQPLALSGNPSSVANRVSYYFNFHGPSMAVDTMCSSSLTALHLACQSLQRGACEQAIAGGVNVSVHPNKYLMLAQGKFASSKGRCESFGEGGDGYVPGEGVGAVLLKPLAKAIADGDHIYGIIKGTAVNHGGKTNGYTVPNPKAQTEVIARALKEAGVHPRTVSYIEAHGTGTALGDPIEIAGLQQAFQTETEERGFCAIGSAKSNIGHLESAAGIAGLTKVLLQMQHGELAPSLHAEVLNPNIAFGATPFRVQRELGEWKRPTVTLNGEMREYPRIAGLSSFGAGGSNAHIIVEEYIEPAADPGAALEVGRPLIVLSAKNGERLWEQAKQLLERIRCGALTDGMLADAAYTLQVGREALEERLALAAGTVEELSEKLQRFVDGEEQEEVYHGQLKQHKEALALFRSDEDMEEAVDAWMRKGKVDKLLELWVKGWPVNWKKLYGETQPRRLSLPTYPFAQERCWVPESPAVVRNGGIGNGGVGNLNPLNPLHPLVHRNTSDFANQSYESVLTGREYVLADHRVNGRRVLPGVAQLEMARAAAADAAGAYTDGKRGIWMQGVTWLRPLTVEGPPEAVRIALRLEADGEIAYEIGKPEEGYVYSEGRVGFMEQGEPERVELEAIRQRCEHEISGEACYAAFQELGISYGPGMRSVVSVRTSGGEGLAELRLPEAAGPEAEYVLNPGMLDGALQGCAGLALSEAEAARLMLPYALEKLEVYGEVQEKMWAWIRRREGEGGSTWQMDIDLCDERGEVCIRMRGLTVRAVGDGVRQAPSPTLDAEQTEELPDTAYASVPLPVAYTSEITTGALLLTPGWVESLVDYAATAPPYTRHVVLLGTGDESMCAELESSLDIRAGNAGFAGSSPEVLCLGLQLQGIGIAEYYREAAMRTFQIVQRIIREKPRGKVLIQLMISNRGEQRLLAGLSAMLKTAASENPHLIGQLIEAEPDERAGEWVQKLKECASRPEVNHFRYHSGKRWMLEWNELDLTTTGEEESALPCKDNGVYLITGGAGGLGTLIAREISRSWQGTTLILTGRSSADTVHLDNIGLDLCNGTKVIYQAVDVADRASTDDLFRDIQTRYGGLDGIIHSAGVHRDNYILKKTGDELQTVLAPKVSGLVNLDEASRSLQLDFVLLYSSIAGAIGNAGQADYAAANGFMDAYAAYRNELAAQGQRHGRTLTINWPLWKEGGMQVDKPTEEIMLQRYGLLALDTATGIRSIGQCWASGQQQVVVMKGDLERLKQQWLPAKSQPAVIPADSGLASREYEMLDMLIGTASELLMVNREAVDPWTEWSDFGFDYVMLAQFAELLNKKYGFDLTPALFYEHHSLHSLALQLLNSNGQADAETGEGTVNLTVVPQTKAAGGTDDGQWAITGKLKEDAYYEQLVESIAQGKMSESQLLQIMEAT